MLRRIVIEKRFFFFRIVSIITSGHHDGHQPFGVRVNLKKVKIIKGRVKKKLGKSGQADRFGGGGGVTPPQPDHFYL